VTFHTKLSERHSCGSHGGTYEELRLLDVGGTCSTNGKKMVSYRLLVRKPAEKGPLGRPRRGLEDNIKMDLVEIEWADVDWIGLA
jgi:hypothetical protein